jgi:hypothetical protein
VILAKGWVFGGWKKKKRKGWTFYQGIEIDVSWDPRVTPLQHNATRLMLVLVTRYAMKTLGGGGCADPHFLELGTSWKGVVSFTPWTLYPRRNRTRYPLDRRLFGLEASLKGVKKRKFFTLPGLESRPLGRRARSQSVYRLSYLVPSPQGVILN